MSARKSMEEELREYEAASPVKPLTLVTAANGRFPVYPLLWHPVRTRMVAQRSPHGRLIGVEYVYDYQPSEPEFQRELSANDVVWIPLYNGTIRDPPRRSDHTVNEYEANLRTISEIAPRVRAVLIGNANAEIHYKDILLNRRQEHALCLRFVRQHGEIVSRYGRPAFAPIFELLVYDCYEGGGRLRDLFRELNALVLSYAGCSWLFEMTQPRIPEPRPFPRLAEYIATLDAWSGVGMQKGLDAGSGEVLYGMGYKAGFMGWW